MFFKSAVDYLVYLLVRILICILQALRVENCVALSKPLVWLVVELIGIRRQVIDENLRHAFPDLSPRARDGLARRHWEHLFLMVIEIAHAVRKIHLTNWRDYVCFRNKRLLLSGLLEDRPSVMVAGHFGNFEVAGFLVGLFGLPTFTVARPLDNPYLDRFVNSFRSSNGQRVLPKRSSSADVVGLLSQGGTLMVLGDQSAGPKGCWVSFFGRPASTHKAIALFSLGHEAPLMVGYTVRRDAPMSFEIGCEAVADPCCGHPHVQGVPELTGWFTARLEDVIRRAPEQYWWVHRRWKCYPEKKRRRRRAA